MLIRYENRGDGRHFVGVYEQEEDLSTAQGLARSQLLVAAGKGETRQIALEAAAAQIEERIRELDAARAELSALA